MDENTDFEGADGLLARLYIKLRDEFCEESRNMDPNCPKRATIAMAILRAAGAVTEDASAIEEKTRGFLVSATA